MSKFFQALEIGDCVGIISHQHAGVELLIATIEDVFLCSKTPHANRIILNCQDFLEVDLSRHETVIKKHSIYYADASEAVNAYKQLTQDIAEEALNLIALIKKQKTTHNTTWNSNN